MESLGDEPFDVVICGTGLQQSLLALALSRSKKRVLHLDPNDYYGQNEAALSLQEVETWVAAHSGVNGVAGANVASDDGICRHASLWKHPEAEANGLSFPRAYSLALASQIVHTRSQLLSQLVSSRAYRQVDFLAVGSFFVYEAAEDAADAKLSRIPSSREDVFLNSSIVARSKRALMKFLKFVVEYNSDEHVELWQSQSDGPLDDFLAAQFKLDDGLRKYIFAFTLTLNGKISVKNGLAAINRHLTSMGVFGPGFCAVYPKWGGLSEVAQVACRAGAVGGGIYMLGTSMEIKPANENEKISLSLSNEVDIQTSAIISSRDATVDAEKISRIVAVINSPLKALFEVVVEGAPTPAVAVVAFPSGTISANEGASSDSPIYTMVHSSDTGECPNGQSVMYLTTLAEPQSKQRLEKALDALLKAASDDETTPLCLYQLYYEQTTSERSPLSETQGTSSVFSMPSPSLELAFDDSTLDAVKAAWRLVMGNDTPGDEFMNFEDREGADTGADDVYD